MIKAVKRENYVYAFISGIAMGIVPTIRYAEFVLSTVLGAYIFWLFYTKKISLRTFISFIIGVLIPLIPLAVRNHIAFGKFWITGYTLNSAQVLFGFSYLIEHFIPFVVLLITAGMGILFLFSIGGFVRLLRKPDTRSIGVYFLSSIVILTFTYMAYSWRPDPQTMRFLLPTFPIYTLVAVYFISRLKRKYQIAFLSIALLVSLPWGVLGSLRAVKPLHIRNSVLKNITNAVEKNIEEGSIIITSEGICQNLDVYCKWKLVDISILTKADALRGRRPMKPIRNESASRIYSPLYGEEFKNQFVEDLCQWLGGKIYLITYEDEIEMLNTVIGNRFNIDKKRTIKMSNLSLLEEFMSERRPPHRPGINQPSRPHRPRGPNWIFDFEIRREPLIIAELTVK